MGAIVNSVVIIFASLLGLLVGRQIPERLNEALMQGVGLIVLTIGISGAIQGQNTLVLIASMVVGILMGEGIDIDDKVNRFVVRIGSKLNQGDEQNQLIQGFLSASMLFCIGSMAIIGSLESGLLGDNTTLYTKSVIDGVSAILLTSSLGIGVIFSSIPVLIYQGAMILFAQFLAPLLSDAVILEITTVGSVLLIGMGLNLLKITDIKIMNFVPAVILPIFFMFFI